MQNKKLDNFSQAIVLKELFITKDIYAISNFIALHFMNAFMSKPDNDNTHKSEIFNFEVNFKIEEDNTITPNIIIKANDLGSFDKEDIELLVKECKTSLEKTLESLFNKYKEKIEKENPDNKYNPNNKFKIKGFDISFENCEIGQNMFDLIKSKQNDQAENINIYNKTDDNINVTVEKSAPINVDFSKYTIEDLEELEFLNLDFCDLKKCKISIDILKKIITEEYFLKRVYSDKNSKTIILSNLDISKISIKDIMSLNNLIEQRSLDFSNVRLSKEQVVKILNLQGNETFLGRKRGDLSGFDLSNIDLTTININDLSNANFDKVNFSGTKINKEQVIKILDLKENETFLGRKKGDLSGFKIVCNNLNKNDDIIDLSNANLENTDLSEAYGIKLNDNDIKKIINLDDEYYYDFEKEIIYCSNKNKKNFKYLGRKKMQLDGIVHNINIKELEIKEKKISNTVLNDFLYDYLYYFVNNDENKNPSVKRMNPTLYNYYFENRFQNKNCIDLSNLNLINTFKNKNKCLMNEIINNIKKLIKEVNLGLTKFTAMNDLNFKTLMNNISISFKNSILKGYNFSNYNLESINNYIYPVDVSKIVVIDFEGSDLTKANMENSEFINFNFKNANLTEANLKNTNLFGANLSGADLTGADLSGTDLTKVIIDKNTKTDKINLTNAKITLKRFKQIIDCATNLDDNYIEYIKSFKLNNEKDRNKMILYVFEKKLSSIKKFTNKEQIKIIEENFKQTIKEEQNKLDEIKLSNLEKIESEINNLIKNKNIERDIE